VEELKREVGDLRELLPSAPSTAAAAAERQSPAPVALARGNDVAPASGIDRVALAAQIRQELDAIEQERREEQRKQGRERMSQMVKSAAERLGLDGTTGEALAKLYLESRDREEDVRKAYPVSELDDSNAEKRRIELDAVRKERDARVASMLPAEKREEWDRRTRFVNRGGDFQGAAAMMGFGDLGGGQGMGRALRNPRPRGPSETVPAPPTDGK
jgi:hypothetical protein